MKRPDALILIGARPQFIKSAPVISELLRRGNVHLRLIHSGQHYDREMSAIFFKELRIPRPSLNLQAGSGTHAVQTGRIMMLLERELTHRKPDMVIVPGDTNTTLAGALASVKLGIPVAHVEAGLRSGDLSMPEEVNRKVTDHCSSLLFAPTKNALLNLRREGFGEEVHLTGDTMVDSMRTVIPFVRRTTKTTLSRLGLVPSNFLLVTLHRPSNVDDPSRLRQIIQALRRIERKLPVVFPVHPRTHSRLARSGILKAKRAGFLFARPQGYLESLALVENARCLLTDSGGMQKEAFLLGTPCITLRPNTEWPETLKKGANRLVTDPRRIARIVLSTAFDRSLRRRIEKLRNPFGDGKAATRIAQIVEHALD